jgi:hypothetical protein
MITVAKLIPDLVYKVDTDCIHSIVVAVVYTHQPIKSANGAYNNILLSDDAGRHSKIDFNPHRQCLVGNLQHKGVTADKLYYQPPYA